jgi:DNA-binding response OmpR family regulator
VSFTIIASVPAAQRRLVGIAARAIGAEVEHVEDGELPEAVRRSRASLVIAATPPAELEVPVIVLVRGGAKEKIGALAAGAADVVGVPFDVSELAVRIAAVIGGSTGTMPMLDGALRFGAIDFDVGEGAIRRDGSELHLSPIEQRILIVLAAHDGEVTDRGRILEAVWGPDMQPNSNLIDRHIRDLRRKLADEWRRPNYIVTVRGQGYAFRKEAGVDTNTRLD